MKSLCKYVQCAGLVSALLSFGALAGLIAPLSAHASGVSLTIQVDNGTPVSVLGSSGACPSGYNQCFLTTPTMATGNNGRGFNVLAAPGTLATGTKLLINDTASADAFKFTSVSIAPSTPTSGWSNSETHVVKIVMSNRFDAAPNSSGNYVVALRSGGYMQGAGAAPIVTQYDFLKFEGTGTFSPSLVNVNLLNSTNPNPLQLQVANQAPATYFTLNQLVTYPTFGCDVDGAG